MEIQPVAFAVMLLLSGMKRRALTQSCLLAFVVEHRFRQFRLGLAQQPQFHGEFLSSRALRNRWETASQSEAVASPAS